MRHGPARSLRRAICRSAEQLAQRCDLDRQIALLNDRAGGEWIVTVPRVGYRFAGVVTRTNGQDESADAVAALPLIAVMPFGIVSEELGKDHHRGWHHR